MIQQEFTMYDKKGGDDPSPNGVMGHRLSYFTLLSLIQTSPLYVFLICLFISLAV